MKKIVKNLYLIFIAFFAFSACDMFRIDNYDGPNTSFNGKILDEVTNELVPTDVRNGSHFLLQEDGYRAGTRTKIIHQNGEFRDDMFFAGTYNLEFESCNFYPFKVEKLVIGKGNHTQDFKVKPYIRVKNASIRLEGTEIVATFNLQAGDPEVRLNHIRLYASYDIYVGDQFTSITPQRTVTDDYQSPIFEQSFSNIVIDESVQYTLKIDLTNTTNKNTFKYQQDYYFRIGAMAAVSGVGTIRRNYAQHTIINFKAP